MIVWITHAKVGHRQTPYTQQTRPRAGFAVCGVKRVDLLEFTKTNSFRQLVSAETHTGIIDVMSEPQYAAQQPIDPRGPNPGIQFIDKVIHTLICATRKTMNIISNEFF